MHINVCYRIFLDSYNDGFCVPVKHPPDYYKYLEERVDFEAKSMIFFKRKHDFSEAKNIIFLKQKNMIFQPSKINNCNEVLHFKSYPVKIPCITFSICKSQLPCILVTIQTLRCFKEFSRMFQERLKGASIEF